MINKNELELYIHIPFCVRKCNYCDFLSWPGDEGEHQAYVNALVNEIRSEGEKYRDRIITSVYIGGGTPSVLSAGQTEIIINALKESFNFEKLKTKRPLDNEMTDMNFSMEGKDVPAAGKKRKSLYERIKGKPKLAAIEFSMECNPGTVDADKLKVYKKLGINRLSFGLQSAIGEELAELGRIHTVSDFQKSFDMARDAGFTNINVDLMQAVPRQTPASWKKTLLLTAMLHPEHISAYSLIIEEGTHFHARMQDKNDPFSAMLPDEDTERDIYYSTKEILENAGYNRYEISNFALPGFECRHNCGYWQRKNYLGLGLGSASLVDNIRWKNTSEIGSYLQFWNEYAKGRSSDGIHVEKETLQKKDCMEEYMFLGLRMSNGISKEDFFQTFGSPYELAYGQVTEYMVSKGLMDERALQLSGGGTEHRVFLTPKGVDVSNTVFTEFLLDK